MVLKAACRIVSFFVELAGSNLSPLVSAAGGKRLRELAVGFELPSGVGPKGSVGNRSLEKEKEIGYG